MHTQQLKSRLRNSIKKKGSNIFLDPLTTAKLIAAVAAGNIFEWYDFMLFGALSPLIGRLFFPVEHAFSWLAGLATFAVGFLLRPFGGFVIGYLGDRIGPWFALTLSMLLMGVPSFLIGCLPTYQHIGIWAPILLITLRLLQGLSVGGELPGSMIVLEAETPSLKCLTSTISIVCIALGLTFGSLMIRSVEDFFPTLADFNQWGWRLPFLFGIVLSFLGLLIRLHFLKYTQWLRPHLKICSAISLLRQHYPALLKIVGLQLFPAVSFNLILISLRDMAYKVYGTTLAQATHLGGIILLTFIVVTPIFGRIADWMGYKKCLLIGSSLAMLWAIPMYWIFSKTHNMLGLSFAAVIMVLLMGCYYAGATIATVYAADKKIRYISIAVAHGTTFALFAGTAALVGMGLIDWTHLLWAPGIYLGLTALISLLTVIFAI